MSLSRVGLLGWYEYQATYMYTLFGVHYKTKNYITSYEPSCIAILCYLAIYGMGIFNNALKMYTYNKTISCSLTGPNGEPKITHGNTLVSELSLEEVAQTINVRTILFIS